MEAGGAGTDGYGVRNGVILRKGGFKSGELRAEAEVRGAEYGSDCLDFEFSDVGG